MIRSILFTNIIIYYILELQIHLEQLIKKWLEFNLLINSRYILYALKSKIKNLNF